LAPAGSVILLASFAIGPLVQQVAQTDTRQIKSDVTGSVPVCDSLTSLDVAFDTGNPSDLNVNLATVGAIYADIFQTADQAPLSANGSSGICTFDEYQSLSICSRCAEATRALHSTTPYSKMVRPVAVDGGWRQPSERTGEGHEGYCWYELPLGHQWQNDYHMPMNATTSVDLTDPKLAALP